MTQIVLENVHVDFPIYGQQRSLRKTLFERATGGLIKHEAQQRVVVKALDDISLRLKEGEASEHLHALRELFDLEPELSEPRSAEVADLETRRRSRGL